MTSCTQHYKVDSTPETIWAALEDAHGYLTTVMGAAPVRLSGGWPRPGSVARHEVCAGSLRQAALTIVRTAVAPDVLHLEVRAGLLGTLGVDLELEPWGGGTLVTVREYPLSPTGPLSFARSLPLMTLLKRRHPELLLRVEGAQPAVSLTGTGRATS
ncbi:SRPBCC family protein [Streptomyces sp. DH41]|uniref:SRPBCC family protein n=1 Tax=Streptomyces sp. DH41 TaxID=3040125 RepID=UPI002442E340|nr:SRPBCC family protein [Streptomyces sp. DH41]MDG9722802.1 SRPBCC family protein [Streptomyces sp. DH41]